MSTEEERDEDRTTALLEHAQAVLGVRFQDHRLLLEALTHSSFRNEHGDVDFDNQRLEFLGDSVLGCVIAHRLWALFPDEPEGTLTRYRATLVSEEPLAHLARELGLGPLLRLGRGEELTGGAEKPSLLADLYEAVVGAIYLDRGFLSTGTLIAEHFAGRLAQIPRRTSLSDFKTQLQEITQRRFQAIPLYRIVREDGPDHDKVFHAVVTLLEVPCGRGSGRTKKDAEQDAACRVWEVLSEGDDASLPRLSDEELGGGDGGSTGEAFDRGGRGSPGEGEGDPGGRQ